MTPKLPKEGEYWKRGEYPAFQISHDWTYSEYHRSPPSFRAPLLGFAGWLPMHS
jgi:hypothetical protein